MEISYLYTSGGSEEEPHMTIYPTEYFHSNKYTKWYENIVNNAILSDRIKGCGVYYEKHHVIPKSFFDDISEANYEENLVLLTAREHYICHLLLTRMCVHKSHHEKMIHAYNMMCNSSNSEENFIKYNSKTYQLLREEHAKICGDIWRGRNHSEDSREKMSKSHTGKILTDEHKKNIGIAQIGKILSKESRRKISESNMGKTHTAESKAKMSKSHMGKVLSKETRRRMSIAQTGLPGTKHTEETKRKISEAKMGIVVKCSNWEVTLPNGDVIYIKNMKKFCRENNLRANNMSQIAKGKMTEHRGYKCKKLD